jgi:hypothetical protein
MKRKENKKEIEMARAFFPRAGARHALLAVPSRIFLADSCN